MNVAPPTAPAPRSVLRQVVPRLLVPLCVLAGLLATAPWLRSFPAAVAAAPLYGAAVLSVLVPVVTVRLRPGWLWLGLLVDAAAFVVYTLLVVLHDPANLADLARGLYRGPSELLTFALPLVSPRSLMVAPVALTWLAGAVAGECVTRRWASVLPYLGFLLGFGLAYAATQRAAGTGTALAAARLRETLLAAGLLAALLLLRTAQAWVRQDETAEATQPDTALPLRGLVTGTALAVVVAAAAALAVQADAFPKRADAPQRVPSVDESRPLEPLSFVAGLRPTGRARPRPVFTANVDRRVPGYFAIADVDSYDGAGWTFQRTFRPSGGVLPADLDASLGPGRTVTQDYRLLPGPLTATPWMPFLYRPQQVTGAPVNIDPGSGMVVPARHLATGSSYRVRSASTTTTFGRLHAATAVADTAVAGIDTQLPGTLRVTLARAVRAFRAETGVPSSPALPFLQALQRDLQRNYALTGGPGAGARGRSGTPTAPAGSSRAARAGSTAFADVLASILGTERSGSPEQYATLVALVARELGVPARVVTGFRVRAPSGSAEVRAGAYQVTTADAWTWAEVPIVGLGWTVLDAAPGRYAAPKQPSDSATASSSPSPSAVPTPNVVIAQGRGGHAVAPHSSVPHSPAVRSHVAVLVAVVVGVLLLIALVLLAARKPLRAARRRRRPEPSRRLVGAWQESLDLLAEAGLPELEALTSAEIAELTRARFGAGPGAGIDSLGQAANAVVYATTTVVTATTADAAWATHRGLRTGIRRELGIRDRAATALRYHRVPRSGRGRRRH